jgi:hypothetical protein
VREQLNAEIIEAPLTDETAVRTGLVNSISGSLLPTTINPLYGYFLSPLQWLLTSLVYPVRVLRRVALWEDRILSLWVCTHRPRT